MVPSLFARLESLPLTRHGKVDRGALPPPEELAIEPEEKKPPSNPFEQALLAIWEEVLGIEPIGVDESFYDLAGHSLLATRVMTRVEDVFQVHVPLRRLFEFPTVESLAEQIVEAKGNAAGRRAPAIEPHSTESGPLPLSFAQQRLWFLHRLEPDSAFYNCPGAARLTGELRPSALEAALNGVLRRHEVLRSRFLEGDGAAFAEVSDEVHAALPIIDLSVLDESARQRETRRWAVVSAQKPFDLARVPLLRSWLVRLSADEHTLLFTMHHIVSDAWSLEVLVREVSALYEAACRNEASPLPELGVQYSDFARWQRRWLRGEVLEQEIEYWREELRGVEILDLPTDRPRPAIQSFRGAALGLHLNAALGEQVRDLSRRRGMTLFMVLLAGFEALLARYSGQSDVAAGTPIAGRNRLETEGLIGFFVNTLVLRADLSEAPSFLELSRRVREACLGAYAHQDVPFESLVEQLQPERSLSRTPLFQVMFALQDSLPPCRELGGVAFEAAELDSATAKFDLEMLLSEAGEAFEGRLEYAVELFERPTMERFSSHWTTLLASALANPERNVWELPLLGGAERRQVVGEWNRTEREAPAPGSLWELFEERARSRPEDTAVHDGELRWSYGELHHRAGGVAERLAGAMSESLVAVLAERGAPFLAAMLGIWKAGASYLPLDPRHPAVRWREVLRQSSAERVIAGPGYAETLAEAFAEHELDRRPEVLALHDLVAGSPATGSPAGESGSRGAPGLAYTIFTSGSTGRPKGAMVEHAGMINHLWGKVIDLGLDEHDVVAQTASQSFDISVWQFVAALMVGGRIEVIADEEAHDPGRLLAAVDQRGITVLEVVPSLLGYVVEELEKRRDSKQTGGRRTGTPGSPLERLRWLMPTGEALPPELARRWLALEGGVAMVNAYGPTECSDDVTHAVISEVPAGQARVPIGRALANLRLYVVDAGHEPVPPGVGGELLVGGVGVGRGYLGAPALTATAFVPDALSGHEGERLYRTGDRTRWTEAGVLEYLGRLDHQVKLHGFRIELGEIEAALAEHPSVLQSAAVVHGETQQLAAFVTRDAEDPVADSSDEEVALGGWRSIFDGVYSTGSVAESDSAVNLDLWSNSFTGRALPESNIFESVEDTVGRLLALEPRDVLEIGCGTGLLLERVAPHCRRYLATDFSAEVVEGTALTARGARGPAAGRITPGSCRGSR